MGNLRELGPYRRRLSEYSEMRRSRNPTVDIEMLAEIFSGFSFGLISSVRSLGVESALRFGNVCGLDELQEKIWGISGGPKNNR